MLIIKKSIIGVMIVLFFLTCQRDTQPGTDRSSVALVLKTLNNPYFIDMQNGAEKEAQKLGINLIVQAAEREVDVEKQMQIIENLIQIKVAVICVTPSGSKEIIPAIVKANKANIPVIIIDTDVDTSSLKAAGGTIASFIGSDNFEGGRIAGKSISEKLHQTGNVAVLEGIPGHETGDARLRGFHQEIDQFPAIRVVSSQTANWERDQGFNVFQNMMQSHPDIQALFACNDMMALGAIEAIELAHKTGKIIVIGFDATQDARQAILQGTMDGSIAQYPGEMGRLAIANAVKLIGGEKIPASLPVSIEMITKTNLQNPKE
jgi:ribose transport system substrate-binding protein